MTHIQFGAVIRFVAPDAFKAEKGEVQARLLSYQAVDAFRTQYAGQSGVGFLSDIQEVDKDPGRTVLVYTDEDVQTIAIINFLQGLSATFEKYKHLGPSELEIATQTEIQKRLPGLMKSLRDKIETRIIDLDWLTAKA